MSHALRVVEPLHLSIEERLRIGLVVYEVGWQTEKTETGALKRLTILYRSGEASGEVVLKQDRRRRWLIHGMSCKGIGGPDMGRVVKTLCDAGDDALRLLSREEDDAVD